MSLITRCPACRTIFKVAPDQLKISEGWVRCGQCGEVFDAQANLLVEQEPPVLEQVVATESEDSSRSEPYFEPLPELTAQVAEPKPAAEVEPLTMPVPQEMDFQADPTPAAAAAYATASTPPSDSSDTHEVDDFSFIPKQTVWHHPLMRAALGLLLLLLGLVFALQMVVHERDRIAAHQPQLRPWLETLCEHLECEIKPLRQIESIVILDSAFSKQQDNLYRLSLTLKNQARVDLAMPAIELSLTDALDQPMLRRVLTPAELGLPADGILRAGAEAQASTLLTVRTSNFSATEGGGERIAGYRLLAFYP